MGHKKWANYEWDAIAGILTALVVIILQNLGLLDDHHVLPIFLALMALLFMNFIRHTRSNELTAGKIDRTEHMVSSIQSTLKLPDVILIGPRQLRAASEKFVRHMSGETIWFNVCLSMYKPPQLFDALLRPAIENPLVLSIRFVLDEAHEPLWRETVWPRIAACSGHVKVREPRWCKLEKTVSFILGDNQKSGSAEALLSFWGEPFMSESTDRQVPRYIFHVQRNSELLPHLVELERRFLQG